MTTEIFFHSSRDGLTSISLRDKAQWQRSYIFWATSWNTFQIFVNTCLAILRSAVFWHWRSFNGQLTDIKYDKETIQHNSIDRRDKCSMLNRFKCGAILH